jgi:hypothetical protein
MGEAGLLHDVSDSDARVAVAPDRPCGDVDDALVRLLLAAMGVRLIESSII